MIRLIRLGKTAEAPPLFVVPGLDGTIGSVEPVVTRLAQKREVIVIYFSAETKPTLESLVTEIAAVVKAEGRSPIDVMGQSIGTIFAAQLATLHGLPVRRVVLTCTFTILRWKTLQWVVSLSRLSPGWLYRLTSPLSIIISCGPVGDGWKHPAFTATWNSDKDAVVKRTAWEINRDFGPDLAKIQSPLLILMGERDGFVPDAAQEVKKLRQMFANRPARVDTIPNAGHIFLPSKAIALASEKIEEFLE